MKSLTASKGPPKAAKIPQSQNPSQGPPKAAKIPPQRTCIGCGQVRPEADLVRLVRTVEGTVTVGRRLAGRGAWIGPHRSCLEQAKQRSAFSRAFRATVEPAALDDVLGRWSGPDEPSTWCPLA